MFQSNALMLEISATRVRVKTGAGYLAGMTNKSYISLDCSKLLNDVMF